MVTEQLIDPGSIVIVGGSNDIHKPGGKVLKNILDGGYKGKLYVTNLKEEKVQGIVSYQDPAELPEVDLAVIAIAAKYIPDTVEVLANQKNTRAFIILSAGFSEESEEGKILEEKIVSTINSVGGSLIGPNCIGVLTPEYHGVFTLPIPRLTNAGCDFISGSGATACFIMEAGIPKGLPFARVFSVGNSAQMGVEEILKYMDETFDQESSPRVKLLYIENISKPDLLLKHASSLIRKGCRIAAIKAGTSEAGSRAASSHTGALASSDLAVDALFRKAGIVRCNGREELVAVASIFMHKPLNGKKMAIITHAGGPAVMLTDILSNGGIEIPEIKGPEAEALLDELYPGSSVSNPIDFLATGTGGQLKNIIEYTENKFNNIDGMAVIFGTPGLTEIFDVYDILSECLNVAKKPIYPILPSTLTASIEVKAFIDKGYTFFPDEVEFGRALVKVLNSQAPAPETMVIPQIDIARVKEIIQEANEGYLSPKGVQGLLDAAGIPRTEERVVADMNDLLPACSGLGYPVVMKVVGPVHKSDVGGVILNIKNEDQAATSFTELMKIPGASSVLIQPMTEGIEIFAGVKYEEKFGHLILLGLGGIFIEVLKDIQAGLAPLSAEMAEEMIRKLKGFKLLEGIRGQQGIDIRRFADIIGHLSALVIAAPEIAEMDLNPLIGKGDSILAVDARIKIQKP
jgi:acetyltransferase